MQGPNLIGLISLSEETQENCPPLLHLTDILKKDHARAHQEGGHLQAANRALEPDQAIS